MGNRRRNLIVLALVVLLTAASVYAITAKDTVLGLDLRGGTELVYQANPTAKNPDISPDDMERAINILRERTDELGVSEPEIAQVGPDQIEVGLPDVSNAERAIEQVGTTAQLFLYDFEKNVIPPEPGPRQRDRAPVQPPLRRGRVRGRAEARVLPGPVHHDRPHLLPLRREHARSCSPARPRRRRTCSSTRRTASSRRAPRSCRSRRARWWSRPSRRRTIPRPRSTRARAPRRVLRAEGPPRGRGRPDQGPEAGDRPVGSAERHLHLHRRGA